MSQINYAYQNYVVNNREGFDLTTALKLWKTKYADYRDFQKEVITHDGLIDFGQFVEECWNKIEPITVEDALKINNTEERRTYFDCIGVIKLFKSLNPKLLDKQVVKKSRTKWNNDNKEYTHKFEDVYELYEIDGSKLYDKDKWGNTPPSIFAVRCWCTTTNREYWLYVSREAALGQWSLNKKDKPDAIRAIAWTIRISITNPEKIYRQGDIIVVEESSTSVETSPYHLTKKQYLSLITSET